MKIIVKDNGVRELIPDEGMWLYKDGIYSKSVSLAYDADPNEWIEVTDEEYQEAMSGDDEPEE